MHRMILRLFPFAAITLTCLGQTTWTVSAGSQFPTVQAAIAAAAPGDRIEVIGWGPYPAFIVDKGVDVEAITGATCPSFEVAVVNGGQAARVAGFATGFVRVRDCQGAVLLANIQVSGSYGQPGLSISNSVNVFVRGGAFVGYGSYGNFATPGIRIHGSQVVLVGATARGGSASAMQFQPGNGASGIWITAGHVTMVGVSATGGTGAAATSYPYGGTGGDGIYADTASGGLARVLGTCTLVGGAGQFFGGAPGLFGLAARGSVQYTPGNALSGGTSGAMAIVARPILTAPQTVPVGTNLVVSVVGNPNQFVLLGLDLQHGYTQLPALGSVLNLTSTMVLAPVITLDALGAGSLLLPIPNDPAARNQNVFAQAAAFYVGGLLLLGAPTSSRTQ